MGNANSEEATGTGSAGPGNTNSGVSDTDSDSGQNVVHQEIVSNPSAVTVPRVTGMAGDGCVTHNTVFSY
jgi:hypothetical protein